MNRKHIVGVRQRPAEPRAPSVDVGGRALPRTSAAGRSTVTSRRARDIVSAVSGTPASTAVTTSEERLRPAGELARATPTPLSVTDVLNKVPPSCSATRSSRRPSASPVWPSAAVYLVDLEGSPTRLAGPAASPRRSR